MARAGSYEITSGSKDRGLCDIGSVMAPQMMMGARWSLEKRGSNRLLNCSDEGGIASVKSVWQVS
ncbi:hypothetical protein ACLOJK_020382 [Asimina triloba]